MHKTIFLKDYTPSPFLIESADLAFELNPTKTIVNAKLQIKKNPASNTEPTELLLDGENLELLDIRINNEKLAASAYKITSEQLIITIPEDTLKTMDSPSDLVAGNNETVQPKSAVTSNNYFILETTVCINPEQNLSCTGLYLSKDNFCTQNEPCGFRHITYFIDRPDILTKFSATIIADKNNYPVLLSNGNLISSSDLADNKHSATWQDPFPKSAYLFALVAGKYDFIEDFHITNSGRKITLRIFAQTNQLDQCHHAMHALKLAMEWDEKTFGLEYDLDIYQIVTVDDFNFGAMENKSLNIFNSKLLLASPDTATDADFSRIAAVVAHEYFHNWTGNRVTCRDWFQIGLKEGLTTLREQLFMEDTYGYAANRIDSIDFIRSRQFAEDAGPLSHPVRLQSYIEINNFYTITVYEKGAEIARMLCTIFGREAFVLIMREFLRKYDGQAVTIEDFLQTAELVTGANLSQFKLWYDNAGTPELIIQDELNQDNVYNLTIQQNNPAKQNFHIPLSIGLINNNGETIHKQTLIIDQNLHNFSFGKHQEKPLISLLQNFSAPIKTNYTYTDDELLSLLKYDQDPINAWDASQKLITNTVLNIYHNNQDLDSNSNHSLNAHHCEGFLRSNLENALESMDCHGTNSSYNDKTMQTRSTEALRTGQVVSLDKLIEGFRFILNNKALDPALTAQMLQFPTMSFLIENLAKVDIEKLHNTVEFIKLALAKSLYQEFITCYHDNKNTYSLDAGSVGQRSLRNLSLAYLMHLNTKEIFDLCLEQLNQADNMNDKQVSIGLIADSNLAEREKILDNYYEQVKHHVGLTDKWLALNANTKLPGTLARVQKLTKHPAFNSKNPNKVYALIRNFCDNNYINFHQADGAGYQFLADQVLIIDKFNPHLAAAIVTPLTKGHKFDAERQKLMYEQLIKINNAENLSKNVYEIINKVIHK